MFSPEDIITSDKYLEAFPTNYYKTDCILHGRPILWRSKVCYPPSVNQKVIISGHSDFSVDDTLVAHYRPEVWWTINKTSSQKNVFSLPLGITNSTNESKFQSIYGNIDQMIEIMNETKLDTKWVYMNFNIQNYPSDRTKVYKLFDDKFWVTTGTIENTLEGRKRFLREIRNHKFVLCPRGNGIDTHRLWETLYMGSIPIVQNHIAYSNFKDLPICFVDSWEQIDLGFLESEYQRITAKNWDMDQLKISYWVDKIKITI
jgi:hypothetical protein